MFDKAVGDLRGILNQISTGGFRVIGLSAMICVRCCLLADSGYSEGEGAQFSCTSLTCKCHPHKVDLIHDDTALRSQVMTTTDRV